MHGPGWDAALSCVGRSLEDHSFKVQLMIVLFLERKLEMIPQELLQNSRNVDLARKSGGLRKRFRKRAGMWI